MQYHSPRTSELLTGLVSAQEASSDDRISLGDLIAALRGRAFGLSLLLFALPNCLPIPGLPIIFGAVLVIIALQMIWGRDGLWLPKRLAALPVSRTALEKVIGKALPIIGWIEKFCSPRLPMMTGPMARKLIGTVVFVLACLLVITPVPWLGSLPQGLAIATLGLGLTERDGVMVSIGLFLSLLAYAATGALGYIIYKGADLIF